MGYNPSEPRAKDGKWTVAGSAAIGSVSGGLSTAGAAAAAVAHATKVAGRSKLLRFTGINALGRAAGVIGPRAVVAAGLAAAPVGLATGLAAGVVIGAGVAAVRGISNMKSHRHSIKKQIAGQHKADTGKKV